MIMMLTKLSAMDSKGDTRHDDFLAWRGQTDTRITALEENDKQIAAQAEKQAQQTEALSAKLQELETAIQELKRGGVPEGATARHPAGPAVANDMQLPLVWIGHKVYQPKADVEETIRRIVRATGTHFVDLWASGRELSLGGYIRCTSVEQAAAGAATLRRWLLSNPQPHGCYAVRSTPPAHRARQRALAALAAHLTEKFGPTGKKVIVENNGAVFVQGDDAPSGPVLQIGAAPSYTISECPGWTQTLGLLRLADETGFMRDCHTVLKQAADNGHGMAAMATKKAQIFWGPLGKDQLTKPHSSC